MQYCTGRGQTATSVGFFFLHSLAVICLSPLTGTHYVLHISLSLCSLMKRGMLNTSGLGCVTVIAASCLIFLASFTFPFIGQKMLIDLNLSIYKSSKMQKQVLEVLI